MADGRVWTGTSHMTTAEPAQRCSERLSSRHLPKQPLVPLDARSVHFEQAVCQTFGACIPIFDLPGAVHTYVERMGLSG
jgi:hypothetical protein